MAFISPNPPVSLSPENNFGVSSMRVGANRKCKRIHICLKRRISYSGESIIRNFQNHIFRSLSRNHLSVSIIKSKRKSEICKISRSSLKKCLHSLTVIMSIADHAEEVCLIFNRILDIHIVSVIDGGLCDSYCIASL